MLLQVSLSGRKASATQLAHAVDEAMVGDRASVGSSKLARRGLERAGLARGAAPPTPARPLSVAKRGSPLLRVGSHGREPPRRSRPSRSPPTPARPGAGRGGAAEHVAKEGWLWKQGEIFKTRRRRWFVADVGAGAPMMLYYATSQRFVTKVTIALDGLKRGALIALAKKPGVFTIVDKNRRKWVLDCASDDMATSIRLAEDWLIFLSAALQVPVTGKRWSTGEPWPISPFPRGYSEE